MVEGSHVNHLHARDGGIHSPGIMLRLCVSRFLRRVTLSLFHRRGFLGFARLASASCGSAGAGTSGRSSLGLFTDLAISSSLAPLAWRDALTIVQSSAWVVA